MKQKRRAKFFARRLVFRETIVVISSLELVLDLDSADDNAALQRAAAQKLNCEISRVRDVRVRKRSLDARGQIRVRLLCDVFLDEDAPPETPPRREYSQVPHNAPRAVIIGCGPAGMFAALRFLQLGVRPILLERGKDVQARRRDLARLNREGVVDCDSNYCFGEGGAGTYSDGKLYTRVKDKSAIADVLQTLVAHGASEEITIEAHPHIGSNKLPKIVAALRESIRAAGGEIHFGTRVEDFAIENNRLCAVTTSDGREFSGDAFLLASGHSSREIYEMLAQRNVLLEAKPFAMGVRIEHPQPLIDAIQYRRAPPLPPLSKNPNGASTRTDENRKESEWRHPKLPAASYRVAHTASGRGVFSFCNCPGGWIVPSATSAGEVVVNGMSLSRRDSPFSNSGMVVSVEVEDYAHLQNQHGALAGLVFQKELELAAFAAGGNSGANGQVAPAQRVTDFLRNRVSPTLPKTSYQPGIVAAPLHEALPPHFARRLQEGLSHFGKAMRGYVTEEAILVGVESRTSSPLRVPRDASTREHPQLRGLFPCGEGAGYAGGIVSAAIDGALSASACAALLKR